MDNNNPQKKNDELSLREKVEAGLSLAFERLVREKRLYDDELIFSENGEIVRKKARDIVLESEKKG
jgi:hypothetical protein